MRPATLEICRQYLFIDLPEELVKQHRDRVIRIRQAYTWWYEFPMKSEIEVRDLIMTNGAVSATQAYEDIQIIKVLLGDITNAGKEWHRHRVIHMLEEAYQMAIDKQDPKAMILAADKLGKYTRLDKEDSLELPWGDIIPMPIEPTTDPTVLGLKPIPNVQGVIAKMMEKYGGEIDEAIIDVSIEEVETKPDEYE